MEMPQTLRGLVLAAKASRGTSVRQLARLAHEQGFKIVDTTLNAIANGSYKARPTAETVRAIAWLAGVSDDEAFVAAGIPSPGLPFARELPPGVDQLSPRSRRAMVEVLRALVAAELAQGVAHPPSAQLAAARDVGAPSLGEQVRGEQDKAAEDPEETIS